MWSSRSGGSSSLLPCHASWVDIVDVWARSPLIVIGALHGLDGKEVKVTSMTCTIPDVGSVASVFLYGINTEVLNCSPYSFDLQRAGMEITFSHR
jgi:hypothetical protein